MFVFVGGEKQKIVSLSIPMINESLFAGIQFSMDLSSDWLFQIRHLLTCAR